MKTHIRQTPLAALLLSSLMGCSTGSEPTTDPATQVAPAAVAAAAPATATPPPMPTALAATPANPEAVPVGYSASPSNQVQHDARTLLTSADFATLDARLDAARTSERWTADGVPRLHLMMNAVARCAGCRERDFAAMTEAVQAWAKTGSLHAQVALAWLDFDRGWTRRGPGPPAQVNPDAWAAFDKHAAAAQARLDQHAEALGKHPSAALLALNLALYAKDAQTRFPPLFNRLAPHHLDDIQVLTAVLNFKSAEMYGSTRELRDQLVQMADALPGADGARLYARLQWMVESPYVSSGLVDPERLKQGLLAILERYPHPWNIAHAVTQSCRMEDFAFAASIRKAVGDQLYRDTITDASRGYGCGHLSEWPDGVERRGTPAAAYVPERPVTVEFTRFEQAMLQSGLQFHCEAVERYVHANLIRLLDSVDFDHRSIKELDAFRAPAICALAVLKAYGQIESNAASYTEVPAEFFASNAGMRVVALLREERIGPPTHRKSFAPSVEIAELAMKLELYDDGTVKELFASVAEVLAEGGSMDVFDAIQAAEPLTPEAQEMLEPLSGRALAKLTAAEISAWQAFAQSPEGSEFIVQRRSRFGDALKDAGKALVIALKQAMDET